MRQHWKWTDETYWTGIEDRMRVLAEREIEKRMAAERKAERLQESVQAYLRRMRAEREGKQ